MKNYRAIAKKIRGPLIPILAAFDADGNLDIDSTCRWVDWHLGKGIKLFWTTPGTTHFMCLSEAEVMDLTQALAAVISGRGIFIASTDLWSTRQCMKFVDDAAGWGVDIVKLTLDWHWPGDEEIIEFYRCIAESSPLPLFAYSALRGISGDLLKRILELPQFVGLKNDKDNFYGQQIYLRVIRSYADPSEFVTMTGGGMNAFLFGYEFGMRAYTDSAAFVAPDRAVAFSKFVEEGNRESAVQIIQEWDELVFMDQWKRTFRGVPTPGYQWMWAHTALHLMGHFKSDRVRFPLRSFNPDDVDSVRKFLLEKGIL